MIINNCTDNEDKSSRDCVSVIIPTHNGFKFLARAVESVLNQTYSEIELIVVDDNGEGSDAQKKTQVVIDKFKKNTNLHYLTYETNMNASYARNLGIKNARGKYIAFLDDDDEMLPNKIKLQVECMRKKDCSYAACYTDYKISRGSYTEKSREVLEGKPYFEALSRNFYICGGSNLLVRKDALEAIGGFDESFYRNQDLELLVRLLKKYNIAHVDGIQLIVHMEDRGDRKKTYTYEGSVKIDDFYLDKFSSSIQELNDIDKRKLHQYFALERFKRSIGTAYMLDALKNLRVNRVGIILLIRYVCYLLMRKRNKEVYGFRMK